MGNLLKLSEAVFLGIHAMILIARYKNTINANQIAEITNSSRNHLAKILLILAKHKLVKSLRGPTGGFVLARNPEEIRLIEIYEAIEGKITPTKCPNDKPICPFEKCILNNIIVKVNNEIINFFSTQTLKDYIE